MRFWQQSHAKIAAGRDLKINSIFKYSGSSEKRIARYKKTMCLLKANKLTKVSYQTLVLLIK